MPETEIAAARGFFNLRFWGAYMAAKYGSGSIRPGGSIVFTSGTAGARPRSGWSLGASVCAAMEGLTRALAVELAPIRVNIVAPGIVKSPLWANVPDDQRENMYRDAAARLPVGHVGDPDEVAEAYLCWMQQTYITGQTPLIVDWRRHARYDAPSLRAKRLRYCQVNVGFHLKPVAEAKQQRFAERAADELE